MHYCTGLFKVLGYDGQSVHGGNAKWSLPSNGQPGEWMPVVDGLRLCGAGYHLTTNPLAWIEGASARLFVAEPAGELLGDGSDKACFPSVRLLVEVTKEWKFLPMFPAAAAFLAIKGANLKGAYLKGAYLEWAYLEGANLKGAYLKGAYLEGSKVCLCNSESCANLRSLLKIIGWNVASDGLLEKTTKESLSK